jgi:ABC-type multidrug transport system fused ATPase/permease subunit
MDTRLLVLVDVADVVSLFLLWVLLALWLLLWWLLLVLSLLLSLLLLLLLLLFLSVVVIVVALVVVRVGAAGGVHDTKKKRCKVVHKLLLVTVIWILPLSSLITIAVVVVLVACRIPLEYLRKLFAYQVSKDFRWLLHASAQRPQQWSPSKIARSWFAVCPKPALISQTAFDACVLIDALGLPKSTPMRSCTVSSCATCFNIVL